MKNDRDVKITPPAKAAPAAPVELTDAQLLEEAQKQLRLVYAIANNAIYFADSSDYLSALYGVCDAIIEDEDEWNTKHGKEFIETTENVQL